MRDHFGVTPEYGSFPGGAAATTADGRGWVLPDENPGRALGGALYWAGGHGVGVLHVLVDEDASGAAGAAGILARRGEAFAHPPAVWRVDGRALVPAAPVPLAGPPPLDPRLQPWVEVIAAAGADPVVEHGVLLAEVLGLEVGRVELVEGEPRLRPGVGRFDREAFAELHTEGADASDLTRVVEAVRRHRRPGTDAVHPLGRLAPERWLRWLVVRNPDLVGAGNLAPVPPPVARTNVKDPVPAPAVGFDEEGRPVVVVCSTGIDLDLVPTAVDVRASDRRGARLVLVVPERDDHPVTRRLAAGLAEPAEIATVPRAWRHLGGDA